MPRKPNQLPEAKKRFNRGAWVIFWRWSGSQYTITLALNREEDAPQAEAVRRAISMCLLAGDFPEPYNQTTGVIRYLEHRYGKKAEPEPPAQQSNWIDEYKPHIRAECSRQWASNSIIRMERLERFAGALADVTGAQAQAFLDDLLEKGLKPATRNRIMTTCRRFYNWAIRTGKTEVNPFAGIKILKEERSLDIVYCTPEERAEIIARAEATEWKDWLAVPIAFYSGMRREEVSRLEWQDVRFNEGLLAVRKSKTGRGRVIPLASALETLLCTVPQHDRHGHVVKIADGIDRLWRMDNLIRTIQKAKQRELMAAWNITPPAPSRSKEYPARKKAFEAEKAKRAAALKTALGRIGWNSFRHTFGSLLAQSGVSIDKISAWMGNTPEVCRRHYTQFVPRGSHDEDIEKL